jgi:endonuclease/exonuclease/phosphatase (EEP) superfamily protein YafD
VLIVRTIVRPVLIALSALVTGVVLIGRLPSSWWLIDVASSFRVHAGVAALALLVVALLVRAKVVASLLAISLVLSAPALVDLIGSDPPRVAADAARLRIGHLNLQEHPLPLHALLDELRERHADVFVVLGARDLDVGPLPKRVERYVFEAVDPGEQIVIIVNRRTIRRLGPTTHAISGSAVGFDVELIATGDVIHLLAVHTPSPITPGRASMRDQRLDEVGEWARDIRGPAAVFGDFNATPYSAAFARVVSRGDLTSSLDGRGWQPSWPVALGRFGIPIDHLFFSDELVTVERATGPSFGSAHRSLWVTLARAA